MIVGRLRPVRIMTAWAFLCCLFSCGPSASSQENEEDPTLLIRAYEREGYTSLYVGDGNFFSIKRSSIRAAFDEECMNRDSGSSRVCDDFEDYRWHVVIDDYVVTIRFLHTQGLETDYLEGFACIHEDAKWVCVAEA